MTIFDVLTMLLSEVTLWTMLLGEVTLWTVLSGGVSAGEDDMWNLKSASRIRSHVVFYITDVWECPSVQLLYI